MVISLRRLLSGVLLFLLVGSPWITPQEQDASTAAGRRVALFLTVDDSPETSFLTSEQVALLESGLLTVLARNLPGYSFILATPPEDEQYSNRAASLRGDAWVLVTLKRRGESLVNVTVEAMDLFYDDSGASFDYDVRVSGDFRGNTGRYWFPIVGFLEERLLSADYEAMVRFLGVPGTTVAGLEGDTPVVIDEEGEARIRLPFGESFSYRARREGYHDVHAGVTVSAPEVTLELNQRPRGRWSYELFLAGVSYPGAGVSFYPIRARSLLRFDIFTYAVGLVPYASVGGEQGTFFASEPVTHFTLSFLQHIVAPHRRIRPYLGFGGTTRLLHSDGSSRTEPIAPYGLTATVGAEVARGFGAWFFEYTPLFYFVDEPQLWDQQFSQDQIGYLRLGDNALDLLMVRLGYRLTPPGRR